jgi:hypothetical protein
MGLMDLIDKVTNQDDKKVRTSERALLVYSEFTNTSDENRALYTFVEKSGIALALGLVLHYRNIKTISGKNAGSRDFLNALAELGHKPEHQAVDVIVHMHGNPNTMYFNDTVSSDALRDDIAKLKIGRKLRMFYTTACYGATHAQDMVQAGFACGAGAIGVNANSATEYPAVLAKWVAQDSFADCVSKSYNAFATNIAEDQAKKMGFNDVDSTKRIHGNGHVDILTPAAA